MKKYTYIPTGVCATRIVIYINEDNTINRIEVENGCPGNSLGISALCQGKNMNYVIEKLEGIKCDNKMTSCPDQIAKALKKINQ